MGNFFRYMFDDSNNVNEKSVIGFASFLVLVAFAITDIIRQFNGETTVVNETIFNSFLIMTLGSFGIGSVDKYINKKSMDTDPPAQEDPPPPPPRNV